MSWRCHHKALNGYLLWYPWPNPQVFIKILCFIYWHFVSRYPQLAGKTLTLEYPVVPGTWQVLLQVVGTADKVQEMKHRIFDNTCGLGHGYHSRYHWEPYGDTFMTFADKLWLAPISHQSTHTTLAISIQTTTTLTLSFSIIVKSHALCYILILCP